MQHASSFLLLFPFFFFFSPFSSTLSSLPCFLLSSLSNFFISLFTSITSHLISLSLQITTKSYGKFSIHFRISSSFSSPPLLLSLSLSPNHYKIIGKSQSRSKKIQHHRLEKTQTKISSSLSLSHDPLPFFSFSFCKGFVNF